MRESLGGECILPCLFNTCNHSSVAIGKGAEEVGYGSMLNAIAIKFDTWYNPEKNDPYLNHIAVHVSSIDAGATSDAKLALGLAYDIPDLADGAYHKVMIEYSPDLDVPIESQIAPGVAARLTSASHGNMRYMGVLRVHLDGKVVITVPLNLEDAIHLDEGRAYVGFTGATGTAYQASVLLDTAPLPSFVLPCTNYSFHPALVVLPLAGACNFRVEMGSA